MARTPTFMKRTTDAVQSHRKRAREKGQALDYGLDEFRQLVTEALRVGCPYCRRTLTEATWSSDHATPTSRGGSFALWNVQITCKACNEAKGALTHEEFSALWCLMSEWPSDSRMNVVQRLRAGGRFRR